jgi:hypothetical protein
VPAPTFNTVRASPSAAQTPAAIRGSVRRVTVYVAPMVSYNCAPGMSSPPRVVTVRREAYSVHAARNFRKVAAGCFHGSMDTWGWVLLVLAVVGPGMVFAGTWYQERRSASAQLASIQRKLDLVMDHLDIADAAPERAEVVRHLENGQLIHAVRAYRRQTGAPLLEAKQAVDRIAAERGIAGR